MSAPPSSMKPTPPAKHLDSADDEIDLRDLIDTLLQYAWLVAAVFVVAVAAGVAYAIVATPVYKADALIQVEEKKGSAFGGLKDIAAALEVGQSPVQGEIEILRSRDVVGKALAATAGDTRVDVANRAPLVGDFFAGRHEKRGLDDLAEPQFGMAGYAWGGERLSLSRFDVPPVFFAKPFTLTLGADDTYTLAGPDGETLGKGKLGEPLAFTVGGKPGELLVASALGRPGTEFSLTKLSPTKAYEETNRALSVAETGRQSSVMRVSLEDTDPRRAVALTNEIARAYQAQNVGRRGAEAEQSLIFLQQQLPAIKAKLEESEQALNAFRTRTGTVNVEKQTESLLTRAVGLEKDRIELELKREQLSQRYKADYPELRAVNESLAANRRDQSRLTGEVGRLPEQQKDLLRLARDVQVNTQLYTALLDNSQQLAVAKAGTIGNVRVIDYAVGGTDPVRPQRALIVAVSAVLGLLLGVVAAFVARALRPTLRNSEELERATGLVTYASVPESEVQEKLLPLAARRDGATHLLALSTPEDPAVESLRSLRTGLAFALLGAANKNIVITGPTQGLGKSFITANLAMVLAQAGKRVLVLETDLRRPRLDLYFGLSRGNGLSETLAGSGPWQDSLRRDVQPGVDLLPAGATPPNPGELLLAPGLRTLLEEAQAHYDHILIDSAPVLPVADTLAMGPLAATFFLVVRAEHSNAAEVREAIRRIEGAGGKVKGAIFNGLKKSRVGYGYYYRYSYSEK